MTVAILGAGVMGEALLSGLIRAGRRAEDILVTERRADRGKQLVERYGVTFVSNADAAERADTLAIVVKPQDMAGRPGGSPGNVRGGQHRVSPAAGITNPCM